MNLAGVDLNLLVVFDALMTERHVTRAGQRIGLSQPAMSAALNRLRSLTNDELFVRQIDGMRPTARAEELAAPIRRALDEIDTALDPRSFVPERSEHSFRITMNDFAASVVLPPLVERLAKLAPGIDLRVLPANDERAIELLDRNRIDMAIGAFANAPSAQFDLEILFDSSFACVVSAAHELAGRSAVSLQEFADLPHLLFSQDGDATGFVDAVLAKEGLSRRVAITVPHFLVAPFVLARSNMVATLPRRLIERFGAAAGLAVIEVPVALPTFPCTLLWERRAGSAAPHAWLRNQIAEAARG